MRGNNQIYRRICRIEARDGSRVAMEWECDAQQCSIILVAEGDVNEFCDLMKGV